MSGPTTELMRVVLGGRLNHGNNAVLRWMADNLVVTTDPAGNVKPNKARSREKIDGIVAGIMGQARAAFYAGSRSVYETGGIKTI